MIRINKQTKIEMTLYLDYLLNKAIYCHGLNTKEIATYLISNGCRIHIGPRRRKYLNTNKKETE